jgi:hypothetical protein
MQEHGRRDNRVTHASCRCPCLSHDLLFACGDTGDAPLSRFRAAAACRWLGSGNSCGAVGLVQQRLAKAHAAEVLAFASTVCRSPTRLLVRSEPHFYSSAPRAGFQDDELRPTCCLRGDFLSIRGHGQKRRLLKFRGQRAPCLFVIEGVPSRSACSSCASEFVARERRERAAPAFRGSTRCCGGGGQASRARTPSVPLLLSYPLDPGRPYAQVTIAAGAPEPAYTRCLPVSMSPRRNRPRCAMCAARSKALALALARGTSRYDIRGVDVSAKRDMSRHGKA